MSKLNLRDHAEIVIEVGIENGMITKSEAEKLKAVNTALWNTWLVSVPQYSILEVAKKPLREIRKFASHL